MRMITCPECNAELKTVLVEQKDFYLDLANIPGEGATGPDSLGRTIARVAPHEYSVFCPECDAHIEATSTMTSTNEEKEVLR